MFTAKQREVMQRACGEYGNHQIIVAIEELSELQKELTKALRMKANQDHITEEIADAYIMLYQMCYYFGVEDDDIKAVADYKLKRLEKRVNAKIDY